MLQAKESDPKRYPWATREATVISTKKSTRRVRKVTVVDYLSITASNAARPRCVGENGTRT